MSDDDRPSDTIERHIETVETCLGTTVVETPKRINNPITERTENLTNLSKDGYCRRFLALLSATGGPNVVNLNSSPVATFDKDRWELRETDGNFVLVKRNAETKIDEMVLGDERSVRLETNRSEDENDG
jgi:hypothetical protein